MALIVLDICDTTVTVYAHFEYLWFPILWHNYPIKHDIHFWIGYHIPTRHIFLNWVSRIEKRYISGLGVTYWKYIHFMAWYHIPTNIHYRVGCHSLTHHDTLDQMSYFDIKPSSPATSWLGITLLYRGSTQSPFETLIVWVYPLGFWGLRGRTGIDWAFHLCTYQPFDYVILRV